LIRGLEKGLHVDWTTR